MSRPRSLSHVKYIYDTAEEPKTSVNYYLLFFFYISYYIHLFFLLNLARYRELTGRTHVQMKNAAKQEFHARGGFFVPTRNEIYCEVYIVEFPFVHPIHLLLNLSVCLKQRNTLQSNARSRIELKNRSIIKEADKLSFIIFERSLIHCIRNLKKSLI